MEVSLLYLVVVVAVMMTMMMTVGSVAVSRDLQRREAHIQL